MAEFWVGGALKAWGRDGRGLLAQCSQCQTEGFPIEKPS